MLLRLAVLLALISSRLAVSRCEADRLEGGQGEETKSETEVRQTRGAEVEYGDIWSMVKPMRQRGNGKGRVEAARTAFSSNLKLEWKIDLDKSGNYQLNWCANVSRNEILFALDIDLAKSGFRIGRDIFAIGFSERGEFASSDFCLVWFDLSHRIHLQDARTTANNTLQLVDPGGSVCRLLNHHHSTRQAERESPVLKADIDYEDDEARLEAERRELGEPPGEKLEIIFTRPLELCDQRSSLYHAIDEGTTHLVWFSLRGPLLELDGLNLTEALRASGPMKEGAGEERAGMRRVQMIASRSARGRPSGSRVFDARMQQYAVPARETTYMCKLIRLPAKFETRRYHITSYEALIEPGNEHVVHHMELFNCANLDEREQKEVAELAASGWAGECGSPERPAATQKCKRVILAWAMGARPLVYPAQVGQSIGGHGYSPFLVLEVHYNNVDSQAGLRDSSGLRFHYSAKLRPFDAGVLEVGLEYSDKNSIPPNMLVPLSGHCVSECTRAAMSAPDTQTVGRQPHDGHANHKWTHEEVGVAGELETERAQLQAGIYIFAAQMHTHLTGVASWTEHVRGGELLGEVQRDDHYSPHFQEIRLLPEPVHLAPGDALLHYCLYDTRKRRNITLGGFATTDEMCVTYLHYYPRLDLEVCKSSVDSAALSDYFANLARDEGQQSTPLAELAAGGQSELGARLKTIGENYRAVEWSARRSRELIAFYEKAPLSVQCNRSDGRRWPGEWNGLEPGHFLKLHRNFSEKVADLEGDDREGANEASPIAMDKWRSVDAREKGARELVQYRGFGSLARRRARCGRNSRPA